MKILVPVKRVLDFNVKVRIKPDHSGVDLNNAKMSMNPFDEIAVEEAIRIKEKGLANEIVIVSVGVAASQETIRTALALGADRGILIEADDHLEPLNVAKCLQAIVEKESPQLILMGKQSIDGDNNQTGQMLAGLLDWPQVTYASQVVFTDEELHVTREIDGGLETLAVKLPAVITTDLRLNEPRYASLPNIMKAKRKPLEILTPDALGIVFKQHLRVTKVSAPSVRQAGVMVGSVAELVDKLSNEAKVIE